jgi:hypothetical protein
LAPINKDNLCQSGVRRNRGQKGSIFLECVYTEDRAGDVAISGPYIGQVALALPEMAQPKGDIATLRLRSRR